MGFARFFIDFLRHCLNILKRKKRTPLHKYDCKKSLSTTHLYLTFVQRGLILVQSSSGYQPHRLPDYPIDILHNSIELFFSYKMYQNNTKCYFKIQIREYINIS